jgi:predicted alpha/beta hydrolase
MQSTRQVRTKDGKMIWVTCFIPQQSNRKLMVIAPTACMAQDHYAFFASFLQEQGYTVITFDYRGMGRSAPVDLKGYRASMHQWAVQDIDAVILFAKKDFPNQEIIFTGHGIGGEIIGLTQASQYLSRLILVNSALSCKKLWPLKYRIRASVMNMVIRSLNKGFGYFPGKRVGYQENIPGGVIHEWINWCSNRNGLFDTFPDNNYRKFQVPLLVYSFSDDWHCPPKAVQELLNHFDNTVTTWEHLHPRDAGLKKIGHGGFFSAQAKEVLWRKFLASR